MTVAMGTVFVLNAVALFVFPPIGHALGLTPTQFGTWAGIAIHDISSVVGAAAHYGGGALGTATAVKLSRALWIVPVSLAAAFAFRRGAETEHAPGRLQIPWFHRPVSLGLGRPDPAAADCFLRADADTSGNRGPDPDAVSDWHGPVPRDIEAGRLEAAGPGRRPVAGHQHRVSVGCDDAGFVAAST